MIVKYYGLCGTSSAQGDTIDELRSELAEARKALVALHLAASALAGYDDMGSALNYYERVEEKHTTAIEKAREAGKGTT